MARQNSTGGAPGERGGILALVALAAAGAGAALLLAPEPGSRTRRRVGQGLRRLGDEASGSLTRLQREIGRRRRRERREKRIVALVGFLVGAGLTALLTPEAGPSTRRLLGSTLSRIKVGAVDRIERARRPDVPQVTDHPVRSIQELGRDPNDVF